MEGLNLLLRARAAGLTVRVEAGELVIRGPRSASHIVEELTEGKASVLRALAEEQTRPTPSGVNAGTLTRARKSCDWCRGSGLVPYRNQSPLSTSNYLEGTWADWAKAGAAAGKPSQACSRDLVANYCPICFGVGLPDRWPAPTDSKDQESLLNEGCTR